MQWLGSIGAGRSLAGLLLAVALATTSSRALSAEGDACPLQLEVFINQAPTHLIGAFDLIQGRKIAAKRAELEEIGLKPRGYASPDQTIVLDELVGLSYRYDEATQQIYITVTDELRMRRELNASSPRKEQLAARTDYGAVLNYDLYAATTSGQWAPGSFVYNGGSATLDGRIFTPFGTLSQTGILRNSFASRFDALRLDTTWAYSDQETMTTYRAGDEISGALAWTRPIRIGGLQAQRNFGLRPDLVTLPLPSAMGSAAVPSTVDVFVNNVRTSSQDIESGPYRINNVPAVTGAGTARVVLRDASGRETVTNLPFYVSPKLLAPGLFDYSLEAGMPRLSYGTTNDTYSQKFVVSGTGRWGIWDWLTVEGHAEAGAGLMNLGAGAAMRTGSFGVASAALAASHYSGALGWQSYLGYETAFRGITLQVSSQRTFGAYDDLASVSARLFRPILPDPQFLLAGTGLTGPLLAPIVPLGPIPGSLWFSARTPRALDRVSIGLPLPFDLSSLSVSFIHMEDARGKLSNILSTSWSRGLPFGATIFATAYADISERRNCGILAGFSIPLGGGALGTSAVSRDRNGLNVTTDAVKPLGQQPGSFGWRLHDSEGAIPDRGGAAAYRSSFARTEVGVRQVDRGARATAEVEGAVVTMGNGVFLANRIDDGFAVIDTGVPGVEVFHENRSVGFTDASGHALVTGLRSYQKNKIAIDTRNLPVDAEIAITQDIVAPADRSGVRVNFAVRTDTKSAILVVTGPDGKPLPPGTSGKIDGGEDFVIGYDGRAFVKGLAPQNTLTATLADRECRAVFDYSSRANEQQIISVRCR
jgi:outer membrane usher protein